jgi:hypothetical protein
MPAAFLARKNKKSQLAFEGPDPRKSRFLLGLVENAVPKFASCGASRKLPDIVQYN